MLMLNQIVTALHVLRHYCYPSFDLTIFEIRVKSEVTVKCLKCTVSAWYRAIQE